MALLNILAKSHNSINWDNLLISYSKLKLNNVEIFPIPKELGFDVDSLGVNVHHGYFNKQNVIIELKKAIDLLTSYDLKFIELYNGVEVTKDNVVGLADKMLPLPV